MATFPDDTLKSIEVATEAYVKVIAFDIQIIEDNLKYSNWMSALAVGFTALILPKYSEFRPRIFTSWEFLIALAVILFILSTCVAMGGLYHWQSIRRVRIKRQKTTLVLKQHSLLLSEEYHSSSKKTLYQQIWDMDFLDPDALVSWVFLENADKKPRYEWIFSGQTISIILAMLLTFGLLFLSILFPMPD